MPYNAAFGIDKNLWDTMSQDTQVQVDRLVAMRKSLAGVKLLLGMQPDMDEQQAQAADVTVLRVVDGKVVLGVFDVPAIDSVITAGPKGAYALLLTAPYAPAPCLRNTCA